jgi:predicted GNAT family acetyltransferase
VHITVTDNPEHHRYEAHVDGELAGFVQYAARPDGLALTHAEVFPAFGGKGVGTAMARGTLDAVRARGERALPMCPFIVSFVQRNPEYRDAVVDGSGPDRP